ncbi:hypothetical protein V2H45_01640 [Tumidithrix elongata RA019]|uniref:Glycosyltransferase RgtA/B/C/D-like domain-containing protein n=1 Tax=Tumidithrix elongata BACA0141 TaxID=2716417 RepID=A0AAW9PTU0_9CYAN|nr:hypothetical protein [Tumidithrix elongata RA019]
MKVLTNKSLSSLYPYLGLILLISPSVVWISLDRHVWPYDQAWYGQVSVELFYKLINSPLGWLWATINALGSKAPGVAWFGQLFVPLGSAIGSIDAGLLLSILVTQLMTLVLMFETFIELSGGRKLIAMTGCLAIASAPLFVAMSHQYFVEPMQTLAVAWFVLIMSFAPKWSKKLILNQLIAATSFAMLAKVSSPMYCLGPGLVGLAYLFRKKERSPIQNYEKWERQAIAGSFILAILLTTAALAWYVKNWNSISSYVISVSSDESFQSLYGKKDSLINKILYWLDATRSSFFYQGTSILVIMTFILAISIAIFRYIKKGSKPQNHFNLCALVSFLQIFFVLRTFWSNIVEEHRYLLPLIIYFAVIISWSLVQINRKFVTSLLIAALILQLLFVHSQALNISYPNATISYWLHPLDQNPDNANDLNEIAKRTCSETSKNRYNIVAIELPWLNSNSMSYFAAKQLEPLQIRCYYTSLGYTENNLDKAWERLLSLNTNYFIAPNRTFYPDASDPFNRVALLALEKVQNSRVFRLESSVNNSKINLFKKIGSSSQ